MSSSRINYSPLLSNRNAVINGNFAVWQRGTTGSNPTTNATAYCADRWVAYRSAWAAGITWSRITPGPTGFQYGLRIARTDGNTALDVLFLRQAIETVNSYPFQGQTVTLSFWARKGSGYSAASSSLAVAVDTGTGADQSPTGTITGYTSPISSGATLTTSWQKFTYTGTISSSATQLFVTFGYTPVGTAASDYFEISGVQLEMGSAATPFEHRSYQQELALCQRYYQQYSNPPLRGVCASSATIGRIGTTLPVEMRIAPTATFSGTNNVYDGSAVVSLSAITNSFNTTKFVEFDANTSAGLTQGRAAIMYNNGSNGTMALNAEL